MIHIKIRIYYKHTGKKKEETSNFFSKVIHNIGMILFNQTTSRMYIKYITYKI